MGAFVPLVAGEKRNRLTAVARVRSGVWLFGCDCGGQKEIKVDNFRNGHTKSCGCLNSEATAQRNRVHGMHHFPEYRIWCNMRQRCFDENSSHYPDYGARGIKVCDRWVNSFPDFLADVGVRPSKQHSLDRIDNDKGYEPSNVRWSLQKQQVRNRRSTKRVVIAGQEMPLGEACERWQMPYGKVNARLSRGWSIERALGIPDEPAQEDA